jgi:hypothetical protein
VGLAVATSIGFLAGYKRGQYHWDASPRPGGITLAKVLRQRGVSPESIAYMRFIGDESSYSTGQVATNSADVAWIWDRMIETAEPYAFWESSGFRRVEVYTHDGSQPAIMLHVNATDATSIAGDGRSFMCHGLHDLVVQHLSPPQTAKLE